MALDEIVVGNGVDEQIRRADYWDDDLVLMDNVKDLAVRTTSLRVEMNLVNIVVSGKMRAMLNGHPITIEGGQLLICPPHTTFSDYMFSPDTEFKAVLLTQRLLQAYLREKMNIWNEMMYIYHCHVVTMEPQDVTFFTHFYELLRLCIDTQQGNPFRTDIVQSLLCTTFLGICGALMQRSPSPSLAARRQSDVIFQRFLDLLGSSAIKHQPVEHYANRLCITPKYLTCVCKKASGKTANQWITEYVMEDIRYYLRQTDLTVKQVCDQLGFCNNSFFGKYVKEHFGCTPTQLRQPSGKPTEA